MNKLLIGILTLVLSAPALAIPISLQGSGNWNLVNVDPTTTVYDLDERAMFDPLATPMFDPTRGSLVGAPVGSPYHGLLGTFTPGDITKGPSGLSSANWDFGNGLVFVVNSIGGSLSGQTGIVTLWGTMQGIGANGRSEGLIVSFNPATYSFSTVPEPSTIALLLLGGLALIGMRVRSQKAV